MLNRLLGAVVGFVLSLIPGVSTYYRILRALEAVVSIFGIVIDEFRHWILKGRARDITKKLDEAQNSADGTFDERKKSNAKSQSAWDDLSRK